MNTNDLVEWQKLDPNGLVYPWWTHPFLNELENWGLEDMTWLEFGGGRSTAWLRSRCKFVVTLECNEEWADQAVSDCESKGLDNGAIYCRQINEGSQSQIKEYFALIPQDLKFDIISVDGIFRTECLQWAIDHFKGRKGILIADNYDQDYVWISPKADEIMMPYKKSETIFYQPDHTNHEGKPWNTRFWIIE